MLEDLRVEAVAEALWTENMRGTAIESYPYDRLIVPTKDDLRRLARAALEAADTFDSARRTPHD